MAKRTVKAAPQPWQTPTGDSHEHHVVIYDHLILSDTWAHLSPQACKLYLLLLTRYKGMFSGNKVVCTYNFCADHGLRRQGLPKYFKELERAGLIDICSSGGLYKQPNEYRFSDRWHADTEL